MSGEVFKDTLRRNWRTALYWALSMAVYGAYVMFLVPDTAGLQGYVKMIELMPPAMLQAVGLNDVSALATAEGFLGFAFFTYGAVILSIYAVLIGLSITANDEESGVMDMLLALPLARWRVIIERVLANILLTTGVVLGGWLGLVLMRSFNPSVTSLDAGRLLQACLGFIPTIIVVMSITILLGTLIRRRTVAAGVAGAFVAASYLLNTLGGSAGADIGPLLQGISVFHYYDGAAAALNGLDMLPFVALLAIAAVLIAAAVNRFSRRDIYG